MNSNIVNENTINDQKKSKEQSSKKVRDHRGQHNPHFNKPHTDSAKAAISTSQKARFAYYKKAADNVMTEDRVREIIKETVQDYLAKYTTKMKDNNNKNIDIRL